jgi:serine/threonine-protein kinase
MFRRMGDGDRRFAALDPAHAPTIGSGAPPAPRGARGGEVDPLVGARLRHFELLSLLGRGGMGAVYLANDTSLERPVAVKVLAPHIAHLPDAHGAQGTIARFVREARAQARLRHPNVAQIYFVGEDRGLHFFVMEYLPGPTLDQVLERQGRIPWPRALELLVAAARGLSAAAAEGFTHRDVKPSNLALDREAGIKLLDFGLVESHLGQLGEGSLDRPGTILGSPSYMAPEQGTGGGVDERSDIYALGCTLYHMLTGRTPFSGPSPLAVIAMHVTEEAPPVRALAPDVPEAVEALVARMMAKEPAARFPSPDALVAAVEALRPAAAARGGTGRRALALAVDAAILAPAAYAVGPWSALLVVAYFVACGKLAGRTAGERLVGVDPAARAAGEPDRTPRAPR